MIGNVEVRAPSAANIQTNRSKGKEGIYPKPGQAERETTEQVDQSKSCCVPIPSETESQCELAPIVKPILTIIILRAAALVQTEKQTLTQAAIEGNPPWRL